MGEVCRPKIVWTAMKLSEDDFVIRVYEGIIKAGGRQPVK